MKGEVVGGPDTLPQCSGPAVGCQGYLGGSVKSTGDDTWESASRQ